MIQTHVVKYWNRLSMKQYEGEKIMNEYILWSFAKKMQNKCRCCNDYIHVLVCSPLNY